MAQKQLTREEILQIGSALQDSKSEKRRSAAKKIGKNNLTQLGRELHVAYMKEREDMRTWETQVEMILALGRIGYKKALPSIASIIEQNKPEDMITIAAARTYVRLTRKNLHDAKPVIELIRKGKFSVLSGAVEVLAYDEMIPSDESIEIIIQSIEAKDRKDTVVRGSGDAREFLLSAMSKWNRSVCESYMKQFINGSDAELKEIALAALKGKKTRYE